MKLERILQFVHLKCFKIVTKALITTHYNVIIMCSSLEAIKSFKDKILLGLENHRYV